MNILRVWVWRLALAVSALVVLLSLLRGISFFFIVVRGILAYALIYGFGVAGIFLFEKTGKNETEEVGSFLDVEVGDNDSTAQLLHRDLDMNYPGASAPGGTATYDRSGYAERRQGNPVSGQVNPDLANGTLDEDQQAEIVRRMGWDSE